MKYGNTDDEDEILSARFLNSKFYPCTSCKCRFRKKEALLAHLKYFHKIDPEFGVDLSIEIEKETFCKQCEITLEPRDFHYHMRVEHGALKIKTRDRDGIENSSRSRKLVKYSDRNNFTKKNKAQNREIDPGLNLFCDFCNKVLSTADRYE